MHCVFVDCVAPRWRDNEKGRRFARACGGRLNKNDVFDRVLWPFWCLVCLLVVLFPGGDTMRKDDVFARVCGE